MPNREPMAVLAEVAVNEAAGYRIILDYSAGSTKGIESLIAAVERDARIYADLSADARIAEDVAFLLNLRALGAYYGELLVRHAGATWGEVHWEGRMEPAVTRGAVTVLPCDTIRRRVYDGRHVDVTKNFKIDQAAMAKQRG